MIAKTIHKNVSVDLSIIIVNWNSKDYLLKSIASIEAETKGIKFEIVVIDAASYDGCDEAICTNFPDVRFIQGAKNLGFAKANNEACKAARGCTLLFLNPDTEIEGSAIEILYHQLNTLPNSGIVGPKLLNGDRSIQQSCIRAFPTILNQMIESDALRKYFPRAQAWGIRPLLTRNEAASKVDAVSGACLMIKRSVFQDIGMFSTDYFMYSEDIDLCFKVRNAGLNTYYIPTAVVVHHGGASSSQVSASSFSSVMMLESRWRFFKKTRSLGYARLYRIVIFGVSIARIGLALFAWPIYGVRRKGFIVVNVMSKWIANLRWAVRGMDWIKNY